MKSYVTLQPEAAGGSVNSRCGRQGNLSFITNHNPENSVRGKSSAADFKIKFALSWIEVV
jgi:hypothetical protein